MMDPEITSGGEVVLRQVGCARHENTVIGALSACLAACGDETSYEELMGWSGAAFRFQIRQPEWDARSSHGTVGFDCLQCAAEQLGRIIRRVHAEDRTMAVRIQIDQGRPLIHDQERSDAIVGYRSNGAEVLLRRFDGSPDLWQDIEEWTWDALYVVGSAPKTPSGVRVRLIRAIERAVELIDGCEIPDPESGYYWLECGREALQSWASQLSDVSALSEADSVGLAIARDANRVMAVALADARSCASAFLRKHSTLLGASAERHVMQAALLAERAAVHAEDAARIASEEPSDASWSPEARSAQGKLIADVAALDAQTAIELRSALTASGMSAPLV